MCYPGISNQKCKTCKILKSYGKYLSIIIIISNKSFTPCHILHPSIYAHANCFYLCVLNSICIRFQVEERPQARSSRVHQRTKSGHERLGNTWGNFISRIKIKQYGKTSEYSSNEGSLYFHCSYLLRRMAKNRHRLLRIIGLKHLRA